MKKRNIIYIFLLLLLLTGCKGQKVREVTKEEYKIQETNVEYSMIEYRLPYIPQEYEIIKAYKNMLYILIHNVENPQLDNPVDCLMVYNFQSEEEVKRYNLEPNTKIHDLVVYSGDVYISFDNGKSSYFEKEETQESQEIENEIENSTESTDSSYFGRELENKSYFIGKLDEQETLTLVRSLEGQKFSPKFIKAFGQLYYLSLSDGNYMIKGLEDSNNDESFSFDFVDEIQDSIYSNGNYLIGQGREEEDSYFYIVDEDFKVEKIPIEPSEQFFSFIGLKNGIFSSYTDIFDREQLKFMYIDINSKSEDSYKKKIVSSEVLYKFYSNNTDNIVAVDSSGNITFIIVKGSQIYSGKVKGIGDNKYKILTNEDSRYGFLNEESGIYLDIYFN